MHDTHLYGMFAALGASLTWGTNSLIFTYAGSRVGSDTVTHVRLWIALAAMLIIHVVMLGTFIPSGLTWSMFGYLAASGISGFVLGDMFLFEAFLLLGTQPALLIKTLAPAVAVAMGYFFLAENLSLEQIVSVGLTLLGVVLVVLKRDVKKSTAKEFEGKREYSAVMRGVLYAGIAAVGQALAMVLAKPALGNDFSPLSATLMRLVVATPFMAVIVLFKGRMGHHFSIIKNPQAFGLIFTGTILGTVLGVIMAMYAVQHTHVGVATTLMELSPAVVLVLSTLFLKAKFHWRQWLGTMFAIGGSILLMLSAST